MAATVYLAARYTRRLELCEYRTQLQALGYEVPARWLNGSHQLDNDGKPIGDDGEALVEYEGQSAEVPRVAAREVRHGRLPGRARR